MGFCKLFPLRANATNTLLKKLQNENVALMPLKIDSESFRKILLSFPEKAIEFLTDQYYYEFVNFSKSFTKNEVASEEIVQDAIVHVWQNHLKLGQPSPHPIEAYLIKVIKNKSIEFYKRSLRAAQNMERYYNATTMKSDESVESQIIQSEQLDEVRKTIGNFPRREQEILIMRYEEEMSTDQIAGILKISKKAVERALTSGNKRLRNVWKR